MKPMTMLSSAGLLNFRAPGAVQADGDHPIEGQGDAGSGAGHAALAVAGATRGAAKSFASPSLRQLADAATGGVNPGVPADQYALNENYGNQPQSVTDPGGSQAKLYAGRPVRCSSDEAAYAVLKAIGPESALEDIEYGGVIYEIEDAGPTCGGGKGYISSAPIKGKAHSVDVPFKPLEGGVIVATYHTHGGFTDRNGKRTTDEKKDAYKSSNFSDVDLGIYVNNKIFGYLGTPPSGENGQVPGKVLKFDPSTGKVDRLLELKPTKSESTE